MSTTEITNTEDAIDSREIIERIEALENTEELDDLEKDELKNLKAVADWVEDYADGGDTTLIRESYFEDYMSWLLTDDVGWPSNCIDWKKAVKDLRMDYTEIDFDGVAYLCRDYH